MFLKAAGAILGVVVLIVAILILSGRFKTQSEKPSPGQTQSAAVTVIAQNLEIPWGLAFLPASPASPNRGEPAGGPDNSILFTERPGKVKMVDGKGNLTLVATIPAVKHIGEGGLLGIAIHPDFIKNKYIYLYYTYSGSGDNTLNRVARFKFEEGKLEEEQIIVDNIPGAANHNGGRIKFGPDNFLYITTGDAQNPSQAQDKNSLAGKILRVRDEGKMEIYSFGHRNSQGLAWDSQGRLWASEHGRSGVQSGLDELNLIKPGANYGWPTIQGDEKKEGMEAPIINSGPNTTWAPAGAVFYQGSIFFGGLRGETLYEAMITGDSVKLKEHLKGQFGRIRDVVLGPDGFLYITTSNRDARGEVKEGDDKIIRIDPQKIGQ